MVMNLKLIFVIGKKINKYNIKNKKFGIYIHFLHLFSFKTPTFVGVND